MAARLQFTQMNDSLVHVRHVGWNHLLGYLTKIKSEDGRWSYFPIWEHYTAETLMQIALKLQAYNNPDNPMNIIGELAAEFVLATGPVKNSTNSDLSDKDKP